MRDQRVQFVPESHTYYIDGRSTTGSVTGLVHTFTHEFDADDIIAKMRNGWRWPRAGYLRSELADDCGLAFQNVPLADLVLQLWSTPERDEDAIEYAIHQMLRA